MDAPKIVPGVTLTTLWSMVSPPAQVDVLTLDLEGHDHEVILATDFSALQPKPRYILYENNHIPSDEIRKQVLAWLRTHGYEFISYHAGCGDPRMDVLVGLVAAARSGQEGAHQAHGEL